jgi:general secretion pathway protein H
MSATGRERDSGTTLIEALVVVAISALVGLIGFPRLQQGLLTLAQRQAVASVAESLRRTRAVAYLTDRPAALVVATDGLGWAASDGSAQRLPPGVSLVAQDRSGHSGDSIAFFGDGSSTGGAVWVSAGHRSIPVFVAPLTGAVAVGGG